jgi:putative ABC transport system permease protein
MNVADRKREIATLKVLGYTDIECMGYTFREIIIITIIATIVGLPISALIIDGVLRYLEFGSLADVQWWAYVSAAALEIGLSVVINLLLYPRIRAIDMNSSLKALE